MNLQLDITNIKDVQFAEKTAINNRVLYINRRELNDLLAKDNRFREVDIDLAHPGESCRIAQVFDVTEPRAKVMGSGENFPGALGKLEIAGRGQTRVLRGAAIVTVDYTSGAKDAMVIDMSGPGAEPGLYGDLQNVVLLCRPVEGITRYDYQNALRVAGLRAAVYLAEVAKDVKADETEVYNLGPISDVGKGLEHLPRIAYIYQVHSLQQSVDKPSNEPIFYGDNVSKLLPTIVHPNEILDGALVRGYYAQGVETYSIQNHPVVRELYKRHGKELCFVGVVITVAQFTETDRVRSAIISAKLVKEILGADGAVLTKIGGGAPNVDLAQTCEQCEKYGVKTAIVVTDAATDGSSEGALLFNTPYADAIVNVGSFNYIFTLPPMEKVIGGPITFGGKPANEEIQVFSYVLVGGSSQLGASRQIMYEV
jgi:sarcosine reductase